MALQQSTLTLTYTGTQHTDARNLVTNYYQFNDEKLFSRTSGNKKQHKRTIQHTTDDVSAKSGAMLGGGPGAHMALCTIFTILLTFL